MPPAAERKILLPPGTDRVPLGPGVAVLEDLGSALGIEEVARGPAAARFGPDGDAPRQHLLSTTYWLRVTLANEEPAAATWILAYGFPLVAHVELFEAVSSGAAGGQSFTGGSAFTVRRGGLAVPPAERTLQAGGPFHFGAVTLGPGEQRTVYLRVVTRSSLLVSPEAWRPEAMERHQRALLLLFGIGLGVLAILAALRLYASRRRQRALGIAGLPFILSFGGLMATLTGVGPSFVWPAGGLFWLHAPPVLAGAAAASGLLAARTFLATRDRDPWLDLAMRACATLAGLAALWSVLERESGTVVLAVVLTPGPGLFAAAALRGARRGERNARLLLFTSVVFLLAGLALGLTFLGMAPPSTFAPLGLLASFAAGGTLLTVLLADRTFLEQQLAGAQLQAEVAARTRELDGAVQRLRAEAEERRRTLDALRETEERFRVAFETSPDALAIVALDDGTLLDVNRGFAAVTGWPREEALGRPLRELGLLADAAELEEMIGTVVAGGAVSNREARLRLRGGGAGVGLVSAQRVRLGGHPFVLASVRDIGDWKRAEEEKARLLERLRQGQKLEAIGQLAGGVAHDFNNLLSVIIANSGLALAELDEEGPARESVVEIRDAARRASALTRQLLTFGRRQAVALQPLDLGAHVAGMRAMLCRTAGDLELVLDLPEATPEVMADATQVEQVVLNLVANAREAVAGPGRITVSVRESTVGAGHPERQPGRYGVLAVTDTGSGMTPEVKARIFEPFFTTRRRGTGLGLATVYGVARQHGGFVEVESEEGRGSTLRVWIPEARRESAGGQAAGGG